MGKEIKRKTGIMFMLVETAEFDRLTPSVAQVYDGDAEFNHSNFGGIIPISEP